MHIRCSKCGRIEDLPDGTGVTDCDREILLETGFVVTERRVEFLGVCADCRSGEKQ
jgi:Fe2+ or Zn2+ uptake regulation protein